MRLAEPPLLRALQVLCWALLTTQKQSVHKQYVPTFHSLRVLLCQPRLGESPSPARCWWDSTWERSTPTPFLQLKTELLEELNGKMDIWL